MNYITGLCKLQKMVNRKYYSLEFIIYYFSSEPKNYKNMQEKPKTNTKTGDVKLQCSLFKF